MAKAESLAAEKEIGGPRSLTRLLGLFDALARSPNGLTLADLNVLLETPKSSLLNLLRPLVSEGYLMHDGSRYRLGPAIFRLSASIVSVWNFSKVLQPYLGELSDRCHETVFLAMLDRDRRVLTVVSVIEGSKIVRFTVPPGATAPLYCTASGRVLLAHMDQEWQEAYLRETKLESLTPETITNKKALRAELKNVREQGYSISVGETMPESSGMAAPIFGPDGKVLAALSISAPTVRFEPDLPALREALLEVATRASGMSSPSASTTDATGR
ncbi:IclR family transcriptional regulator [Aromatoleum petrolei]|uniref:Helix-turn-helix domain-containing protein n=1 Tax=Aromatoleum petrolei TaxID=76116 RepID=A0ABX1MPF0_9RHOO|nr:IclR family transcriptional regulator [Aromatoleum petrolei]NMF88576.1 helix-turn-helix domain-containing protein [Aromatoleum petrolei]QTQ34716.1 Transcriptional regulator, IclR family [Aromatoleum petrolei]